MFAYLRHVDGHLEFVEIIEITPTPGVPPRPHPTPPDPSPGVPTHPIVLPGDPSWEGPVDPGYGVPADAKKAIVTPIPVAPGTTPPSPPAGMPAGSTHSTVWFGPGTQPAEAWIAPYASQHPDGKKK